MGHGSRESVEDRGCAGMCRMRDDKHLASGLAKTLIWPASIAVRSATGDCCARPGLIYLVGRNS